MLLSDYGDAVGDMITAQVAEIQAINDQLYAEVAPINAALGAQVDAWHSSALYWMQLASKAAADPTVMQQWQTIGVNIASNAQDLFSEAGDASWASRAGAFIVNFPAALQTALTGTVKIVGAGVQEATTQASAAAKTAGKGLGVTLLWVLGAAAAGAVALSFAGVDLNLPFLKIHARKQKQG